MTDNRTETDARWNAWGKSLFNAMFAERVRGLAEATADVLVPQLRRRDARFAELEGRVAQLERREAGEKAIEWPLHEKRATAPVDEGKSA